MTSPCWSRSLLCLSVGLLMVQPERTEAEPVKPDAKPKHTNQLARESSPYLLMHAHNPVNWFPWGADAFAKAKKENKLIFLSIGYSSCHWCHVMERETFMSEAIAKILNERFVSIKVDREERPDIDDIYMTALHATGQRGGWPLSIFLTPDGKPLGGGTYYPPEDKMIEGQKMVGFKTILTRIDEGWLKSENELRDHADKMAEVVNRVLSRMQAGVALKPPDQKLLDEALATIAEDYDATHGGFGRAGNPKFPVPPTLRFILTAGILKKDDKLLKMATHTLDRMALGGIYDQLGGGFHRYSVDREWKVPHFEKMLYDNAQIVALYSQAYTATKKPMYERVVRETLGYLAREMTAPEGGFYSALDADSEGEEGKFYVWTGSEMDRLLTATESAFLKHVYGVDRGPNFEEKYSVLLLPKPLGQLADEYKITEAQLVERIVPLRQKLLTARERRPRPFLDTKILTSWNGLMIAGYAEAGQAFQEPKYLAAAEKAADFILRRLRTKNGRLLRTYGAAPNAPPEAKLNAYLEDYTAMIHGLLAIHDANNNKRWLDEALALHAVMMEHHHDKERGGFFTTAHDQEKLFARAKDRDDNVTPSGNGLAAANLYRLARKTGDADLLKLAERTTQILIPTLEAQPRSMCTLATALAVHLQQPNSAKPTADQDDFFTKPKEPSTIAAKPDPIRLTATAGPISAQGEQMITVTLDIEAGWHAYANPPGKQGPIATQITLNSEAGVEMVKVDYPVGKPFKSEADEKPIQVYAGKASITASFRRLLKDGKPHEAPIEVSVRYQLCNDRTCLAPKTVKLQVK